MARLGSNLSHLQQSANAAADRATNANLAITRPFAVRVIAFACFLLGSLGIAEMLLALLRGGVFVNFMSVLMILAGRGLLRWSNGWRRFVIVISALYVCAGAFMFFATLWQLLHHHGETNRISIGDVAIPNWVGPIFGAGVCGAACWVFYALTRQDIRWPFLNPELARHLREEAGQNSDRWRFSLGGLLLTTVVVAVALARVTSSDAWYETALSQQTWSAGGVIHNAEIGSRKRRLWGNSDQLLFVVLSKSSGKSRNYVQSTGGGPTGNRRFKLKGDYDEVSLPSSKQLYEIMNGRIVWMDDRVTIGELNDYIASTPKDWNLSTLVQHAREMRMAKVREEVRRLNETP